MARDRRVIAALGDVEARRTPGNFVADVNAPRTKDGRPFAVFSPFHRAWEQLPRRAVHGAPRQLRVPAGLDAGDDPRRARSPRPPSRSRRASGRRASGCRAGSPAALERYADRHDRLAGGTSELSPYLHFGCLSARETEQRARAKGGAGAAAFVRQLAWRDFYAHVLLHHPGNARGAYKRQFDRLEWEDDAGALAAWCDRPHRLPGRRRRDAPAPAPGLDAQPRAPDRRARS